MKRKKYNENYFEKIDTEDKAYFLGLIYSDGCVINDQSKYRYQLSLKLHNIDDHILKNLIKCIEGEMEVWRHGQRNMSEVTFSGKKLINDLGNIGVTPNKTFTIKYPEIDEQLERHFLRGYFDGDGCVRIHVDNRTGKSRGDLRIVSGSIDILETINERMSILFGVSLNKLYGPKDGNYKFIGWAGMTDIENIYHGFYDNSNLYLIRKKNTFDKVISEIKNKVKYRKK